MLAHLAKKSPVIMEHYNSLGYSWAGNVRSIEPVVSSLRLVVKIHFFFPLSVPNLPKCLPSLQGL
jgi:hypothetical protein